MHDINTIVSIIFDPLPQCLHYTPLITIITLYIICIMMLLMYGKTQCLTPNKWSTPLFVIITILMKAWPK